MKNVIGRFVTTSIMVFRRSLASWKLLSSVVLGVLLASVVMSSTVIFFDSLREIALKSALDKLGEHDANILVQTERGPTNTEEYHRVIEKVENVVQNKLSPYLNGLTSAGRSSTFFLTNSGYEEGAGRDTRRAFVAYIPDLSQRITVRDGMELPNPVYATDRDGVVLLEATTSTEAAKKNGLTVGSIVSLVPYWTDEVPFVRVKIVSTFDKADEDDSYWRLVDGIFMSSYKRGTVSGEGFETLPLYMSQDAYMKILGPLLKDMGTTYGWLLDVDLNSLTASNASTAKNEILLTRQALSSELNNFSLITELDSSLEQYDSRILLSKLQMFVVLIMITVIVLYYVFSISTLVVDQRKFEITQLRSRGATSFQILAVFVLEGGTISLVALIFGPLIAAGAIGLLGYTPSFSDLSGGGLLPVRVTAFAYGMSAIAGILSFTVLIIPAVHASKVNVAAQRSALIRNTQQSVFQKYYIDVGLLFLGILLFRQLMEQGSLAVKSALGDVAFNQVMLVLPALILLALAMVLLRLFPVVLNMVGRLFSSRMPVGLILAIWQMSRNPSSYSRLILLIILMTGLGIFAASFGGTLDRSFQDRELYAVGSDIRITSVRFNSVGRSRSMTEAYENYKHIDTVSPVFRYSGLDVTNKFLGESVTVLGVDPATFGEVALYRDDYSDVSLQELLSQLEQMDRPQGIQLPDDARTLGVLVKPDRSRPGVALAARLRDANGRYFSYELGMLDSASWSLKEVEIFQNRRPWRRLSPAAPLTLVSLSVLETNPTGTLTSGSILIDSIKARTGWGNVDNLESFSDINGWHILKNVPEAEMDQIVLSQQGAKSDGSLLFAWGTGNPMVARGIYPGLQLAPIPALASQSFLSNSGHSIGDVLTVSVGGHHTKIILIDKFEYFPTLNTKEESFLITGLEPVLTTTNRETLRGGITPNEIWISTDDSIEKSERIKLMGSLKEDGPFSYGNILDKQEALSLITIDPLVRAGWRSLLLISFGSILILSAIGFVSHSYFSFREREAQFALLRTIGLSKNQLMSLMWVEHLSVVVLGMIIGTLMGERLGTVLIPFMGSDDIGISVLPPLVMQVNWSGLLSTYLSMGVVFAMVTVISVLVARKISLNRLLRLGEK